MKNFAAINSKYYTSKNRKGLNVHNSRKEFNTHGNLIKHKNVIPISERQGKVFDNVSKNFNDFDSLLEKQKEIQYRKKSYHKKNSNTYYEQILILSEDQFLQDMENGNHDLILKSIEDYTNLIKEEYGFEPIDYHLHLDEGHIDKNGDFKLNVHAHVGFMNFDFDKEKTILRNINKAGFIKMQDLAAKAFSDNGLNYIRGVSKDQSLKKHLDKEDFVKAKLVEQEKIMISQAEEISTLNSKLKKILDFSSLVENLENYSLEDINRYKDANKDNKPIKGILNNLYRARNQMLKGQDSEKAMNLAKAKIDKWNELAATAEINYNSMIDKQEFLEWKKNKDDFVPLKTYEDMKSKFIKSSKDRDNAINVANTFRDTFEEVEIKAEAKIEAIEKNVESNLRKMKMRTRNESNEKINVLNYDKDALQKDTKNLKTLLDNEKSLTDKLINKGKALGVGPDILEVRDQHIEDLKPKKSTIEKAREQQAKRKEANDYEEILNDIEDLENKHSGGFGHR